MYNPPETINEWLLQFRKRIQREKTILRTLIQWGFANAAFEIFRQIEEFLMKVHGLPETKSPYIFCRADLLQEGICKILRKHYLNTLNLPRAERSRQLLQRAYLDGFSQQTIDLIRLYRGDQTINTREEQAA